MFIEPHVVTCLVQEKELAEQHAHLSSVQTEVTERQRILNETVAQNQVCLYLPVVGVMNLFLNIT